MSATHVSAHLTWAEARHDPDHTPYPLEWRETRGSALGLMFERFRAFCVGHPLTIASGYPTPTWNREQGGAA